MKKVLIIYPHFPPSNLAGVHRPRLFAQHLREFGWEPVILTVHEKYYEEAPDWNLVKLLPEDLRIEKVKAFRVTKPRIIGDIGLRAFWQLYRRARQLIAMEKIYFVYIPIPSFYSALLGRMLHARMKIKYGIDYIDPWVHHFPGSKKMLSRHWFSTKLAGLLEPVAVRKASLITGVAEGYYEAVLQRNPYLKRQVVCGAMPYGGEPEDHHAAEALHIQPYLFERNKQKIRLVYAGAMLPKAYDPLEAVFKSIAAHKDIFLNVEFHFIGTGKTPDDPYGYNIRPLAEKYDLWQTIIHEYPKRIPYLDVLSHLHAADGIFILGSTEPHYTPSKAYQSVLSGRPVFAILNKHSTAVDILVASKAARVLAFDGQEGIETIRENFAASFREYLVWMDHFKQEDINKDVFNDYSAKAVTARLSHLLDCAMNDGK